MCIESLPDHLKSVEAWKGTDHDNWLFRWLIPFKLKYLCFGPRDTHWLHRWREWPKTLFRIGDSNFDWRFEDDVTEWKGGKIKNKPGYLSRIQYWKRWHIQIQWPFFIAFHFYFNTKDVPEFPDRKTLSGEHTKGKLLYAYFGAHRDADKVYWIPSAFIGLCWK